MLTQKIDERAIIGCAEASRFTQIRTRGGSAETLVKALAVNPYGMPSVSVVTIVTPVGNLRIASRKLFDTRTDADAVPQRDDRRIQKRMMQE